MQTPLQDARFAWRMLFKNPGFAAVVVLTLALGIGANAAIFSVVKAVILRPLPYPESEQLVWLSERHPNFPVMAIAYPNFSDWRTQQTVFEEIGVYSGGSYNLTGDRPPRRLQAAHISAGALAALRVQPEVGRLFREDEDQPGAPSVLLISDRLWNNRFGGRSDAINQSITLDGRPFTVIGVMPREFLFPSAVDIWVPVGLLASEPSYQNRGNHPGLLGVARLKSGVTLRQARAEMDAIAARLEAQYPESNKNCGVRIDPLLENRVGSTVRIALWTMLGAVAMVLLIAGANVANLCLARASARRGEMSVRVALGASRGRIMRQVLTESMLMALAGGGLGLVLAHWGLALLLAMAGDALPRGNEVRLDPGVLVFTFSISVGTGLLFGLAPAWQASRASMLASIQQAARGATARRSLLRQGLVVSEVALTLTLLIGAGLMLRTFYRLQTLDPGFSHERVLSFRVDLPEHKYRTVEQQITFYQSLVGQLRALPGVERVGITYQFPLAPEGWQTSFLVDGRPEPPPGERPSMELTPVSPDYFQTLGIRLLRGRVFTDADNRDHLRDRDLTSLTEGQRRNAGLNAIIVDEEFARRYWPNEDPIGKRVLLPDAALTVVGVVARVKMDTLAEEGGFVQAYIPLWQYGGGGRAVVLKSTVPPSSLVEAVRRNVELLDPEQPIYDVRALADVRNRSLTPQRLNLALLGLFAGLALTLAAIGLYGVLSYSIEQRTRELGIRMALGAAHRDLLGMVLRQGVNLTLAGIGLGIAAALALTRLLSGLLYQVNPTDPLTFFAVSLLMLLVALIACWWPARRTTKVDPMVALRYE